MEMKYNLYIVGTQRMRLPGEPSCEDRNYVLHHVKRNKNHNSRTGSFNRKRLETVVKKVEFVNDQMLHLILQSW
jgi:hypothetical protein